MLYVSATLSLTMLAAVIVVVARGGKPGGGTALIGAGLAFGTMFCIQCPCVILQGFLLLGLLVADANWTLKPRTYVIAACALTLLPYLGFGVVECYDVARLRGQFPYESLETRLPARSRTGPAAKPPSIDARTLDDVEAKFERIYYRAQSLEALHEHAVSTFVNSPGFGVMRAPIRLSEADLRSGLDTKTKPRQPVPRTLEETSAGFSEPLVDQPLAFPDPAWLHRESYVDFADPAGFGYFKDRAHVAGFRPHQFSKAPTANAGWKLQTVELVGLILHKAPIVYVSDSLPRMDELRKATVRQLDAFEAPGLDRLKDGQSLFVRKQGDRLRVLGALWAASQCTACHDCERGELLGAFSYVLRQQHD